MPLQQQQGVGMLGQLNKDKDYVCLYQTKPGAFASVVNVGSMPQEMDEGILDKKNYNEEGKPYESMVINDLKR